MEHALIKYGNHHYMVGDIRLLYPNEETIIDVIYDVMAKLLIEYNNDMTDTTKRICISNLFIMSKIDEYVNSPDK